MLLGHAEKNWTLKGRSSQEMYMKEQEIQALAEYERTRSVTETIRSLGYPGRSPLYRWYERKKAGLENQHGCLKPDAAGTAHHYNTPGHPRHTFRKKYG